MQLKLETNLGRRGMRDVVTTDPAIFTLFPSGYLHRRTGNFLTEGAVDHLPKKLSQIAQMFTKQSPTKRNEGHTMQQHRAT